MVEDYQGARTAAAIVDAVKAAIPNHVKRLADKDLNAWLDANNDTTKALIFSEKGTTAALLKVLATEFISNVKFAQIRNKEKAAVEMFGITKYPTLVVLPGGSKEPIEFDGSFSKDAMKAFLEQHASPALDSPPTKKEPAQEEQVKPKAENAAKAASDSSTFSEASASHASSESLEDILGTSTIVLGGAQPTESPDPNVVPEDGALPINVQELPPPIPSIPDEEELQTQCLGEKTATCILVLLPTAAEDQGLLLPDAHAASESLAEIAEKHVQRGKKLFPFYSVPAQNSGAAVLRDALKLRGDTQLELVAINSRRGWWKKYEGEKYDPKSMEDWVDNVRFGDGEKGKLPDGLVVVASSEEKQSASDEEKASKPAAPTHEEL